MEGVGAVDRLAWDGGVDQGLAEDVGERRRGVRAG